MADFERLMDQVAVLKRWSTELPSGVRRVIALQDHAVEAQIQIQMTSGERHGS